MRRALILIASLGVAVGLSACGEKTDTLTVPKGSAQSLSVMLDAPPNANHAGLYQAMAGGALRQAGLSVHVSSPNSVSEPLQLLAAGKVDVALASEPQVLLARQQGTPIVAVAAIVQKPLSSLISLPAKHIASVAELRGKTVGTPGAADDTDLLQTIVQGAGVPSSSVKQVNLGFNLVPSLLNRSVDATFGGGWNYAAIKLQQAGKRPNVLRSTQLGVPTYDQLVVVISKKTIINQSNLIRRFVQALARGYETARADPQTAVQSLVAANPELNRKLQLASVQATEADFFPAGKQPWGYQDATRWNAFGSWLIRHHLITNPLAVQAASTNELLAGNGI